MDQTWKDHFRMAYLDHRHILSLLRRTPEDVTFRRQGGDVLPEDTKVVAIKSDEAYFYPGLEVLLYSDRWPEQADDNFRSTFKTPDEVWERIIAKQEAPA